MKKKKILRLLMDYFQANCFWLKTMLKSCMLTSLGYIIIQFFVQISPLINVWIWKLLIDEFESIYVFGMYDQSVWLLICVYIGVKIINTICMSTSSLLAGKIYRKTRHTLNCRIIKKTSQLDETFFSDPENSDIIQVAKSSEIYFAKRAPEELSLVIKIISFTIMLVTFFAYYPLGALLYLITYIPGTINSYKYKKRMDEHSINKMPEERKRGYYKRILTDSSYAKDLRLYDLSKFVHSKYDQLTLEIRRERAKLFKQNTIVSFLLSILTYSSIVFVVFISVYFVIKGRMTIGMMTLYVGLAKSIGVSFQTIITDLAFSLTHTVDEYQRYEKFMDCEIKNEDCEPVNIEGVPSIEFQNVSFRYPGCKEYILNELSFKIESGKKIALVGLNGAGKSTIIKLLLRFYEPESGNILINDKDIRDYLVEDLHRLFSVCSQNVFAYSMTLKENIAISETCRMNDIESIIEAANKTGVKQLAEDLPNKFESQIGRDFYSDGIELSGGQKQKIALSRAYFKKSKFIILDEPSSALDPLAEEQIFLSFGEICQNKGGILISHRLSSIMIVDEILFLEGGRIIESGTHTDLILLNGKYAEMYNMQAEKYRRVK